MHPGQKFFKDSNRGFSLASVMVGVAIVGIVAVGTLSLFENMTKSQNMADFRTQRDVLVEEIRSHLSDTQACRATLGSISLLTDGHSEAITQIRNADNSPKWITATPYSSNTYRISSLVFNYTPGTSPTNPSTATANLMVQLQALKKVAGVNVSDPKYINISIKRNPTTGAMLECIASAKMSDGIWQRSTNVNDIFYSSGSVGIGIPNPSVRLHVLQGDVVAEKENDWSFFGSYAFSNNLAHSSAWVGMRGRGSRASPSYPLAGDALTSLSGRDVIDGFHVTNYGGSFIKMSATQNFSSTSKGSDITFNTTPNGSVTPLQRMLIDQTGNVGIGTADPIAKLDVDGEIRIKSGGSVCSISNEGSLRYNSTLKNVEFCDGSQWQAAFNGCSADKPLTTVNLYGGAKITGCLKYEPDNTPSCFTGPTLVAMADGTFKSIENIQVGDRVVSGVDSSVFNEVTAIEIVPLGTRSLYGFSPYNLFFTEEHPFLSVTGWKSLNPEETRKEHNFKALPLRFDDILKLNNRWVPIGAIYENTSPQKQNVYNLRLDGDHTYIANGYSVHNKE